MPPFHCPHCDADLLPMLNALLARFGMVWTFDETCPACLCYVHADIKWGMKIETITVKE